MRNGQFGMSASLIFAALTIAGSVAAQDRSQPERAQVEPAHFHHVHLNVTDPEATIRFYQRIFGAVPIKFRHVSDALFTERSFILLNEVDSPPASELESGIWHLGWGGVDVPNEYEWMKSQGVEVHTEIYQLGRGYVTYWNGPDKELIEVNTTGDHRYGHVHFFAEDVNATTQWYADQLGLNLRRRTVPKPEDMSAVRAWSNSLRVDNVNMIFYGMPNYEPHPPWWRWETLTEFAPQKGRAIDHLAFSYRDIEPVYERMRAAGVTIVEPIRHKPQFDMKSFFVLAPDKVLIEIVEAKPIPEGLWDKDAPPPR